LRKKNLAAFYKLLNTHHLFVSSWASKIQIIKMTKCSYKKYRFAVVFFQGEVAPIEKVQVVKI